ncbi:MAG TPA: hypothetical protein VMZ31_16695 [Phycisphaerae bacterium]|nr:hypothetical protein [Phycisphaerae bacterium]
MLVCKRRWVGISVALAGAAVFWLAGGCISPGGDTEAALTRLGQAPVVAPGGRWRARLSLEATLPERVVTCLNDSCDLIVVRTPSEWAALWRTLGAESCPAAPDLAAGAAVGLAARLGEPADGSWPLELAAARVERGSGLLRWQIGPGLYHPVVGPSFVDLAYVRGLRHVKGVYIGTESFVLR